MLIFSYLKTSWKYCCIFVSPQVTFSLNYRTLQGDLEKSVVNLTNYLKFGCLTIPNLFRFLEKYNNCKPSCL